MKHELLQTNVFETSLADDDIIVVEDENRIQQDDVILLGSAVKEMKGVNQQNFQKN